MKFINYYYFQIYKIYLLLIFVAFASQIYLIIKYFINVSKIIFFTKMKSCNNYLIKFKRLKKKEIIKLIIFFFFCFINYVTL